jgi:hypothetical protein
LSQVIEQLLTMLYRIKGWEDSVLAAQELELDEPEGTTAAVGFTELNHNNSERTRQTRMRG